MRAKNVAFILVNEEKSICELLLLNCNKKSFTQNYFL